MDSNRIDHLDAYLNQIYPHWQGVSIHKLEELPAGWESDLYAFDLSYREEGISRSKALVLRVYPGHDAAWKSKHEFNGMLILHRLGYPVPRVYAVFSQPSPVGNAFMIMQRIPGEVMGSMMEHGTPQQQAGMIFRLCALFVSLHNLDWRPFTSDPARIERGGKSLFADAWIAHMRQSLEASGTSTFQPLLNWIGQHRDAMRSSRPSVVHRDFHPNNVILPPGGSPVVIDWSGWQVTDFRFDLAWTLMLADAYGGDQMRQQILAAYEQVSGAAVENIEIFEACACLRRLRGVIASLNQGAETQGMRPQAVEVMRSQMKQLRRVYTLMQSHTGVTLGEVEDLLYPA